MNRPATGIAFGLVSGIVIASYVPLPGRIVTAVLLLAVSAFLYRQTGKQALIAVVILAALTGIWQVQRIGEPTVLTSLTGMDKITESHQTRLEIEILELRSYSGFNARYNARLTAVVLNGHTIRLGQRVIMDLGHNDWSLPPYPAGTKAIAETFTIKHNLNEPQEEPYLNAWKTQGYHAVIEVPSHSLMPLHKKSLYAHPARIRANAERLIDEQLSVQGSQLMKSVFFGNQGYLDRNLREQFSRTGTAHIIAVSGLHVGILALVMHKLLEKAGTGKRLTRIMTLLLIWFYAAMSGFPISILRAGFMYSLYVLAFLLERRYDSRSILMWCAIVFLWINPLTVYSVSFQLSFMATASILWIYPVILRQLLRAEFPGRQLLAVTLAAQLGTWPVIAWHFGTVALLSLPANLLIVPMLGILMPAGLLMTAISLVSRTLAGLPAFVVQGGLSYMIRMTAWLNSAPGAVFVTESIQLSWIIAYYLLLAGVVKILSHKTERPLIQNRWMERGMTDAGQRQTID